MSQDPFRLLRIEYLDRARSLLDRIRELAELRAPSPDALRELRTLVHNLRGSGGFYGFADISAAAATIEEMVVVLQNGESLSSHALAEAVQTLAQIIQETCLP